MEQVLFRVVFQNYVPDKLGSLARHSQSFVNDKSVTAVFRLCIGILPLETDGVVTRFEVVVVI